VAPPAMEASSPKKKVDIAEAMSGLAGAAERKNIFTWDVDWNAVCGSVVELQNAKEAAEKKKADEAARKQVSANKPPPSQVAPAAKPAEATIRPAVGSKHQFP
jgi:cobyrinic acid a,c-diamide synthase